MRIREVQNKDVEAIKTHFYEGMESTYFEEFITDKSVISYVVEHHDEVIGFIYGYILKRINSKPMLYIHNVDVIEKYQGRGVGTMMMKKMLELKEENKVIKVFLITNKSNTKAMKLYTKVGGNIPYNDDVVFEYK